MKTKFLNFVVPMAVVAVGLAGALSTNAMAKSNGRLAPVWGYKHVSAAIPCEKVQMCSNSGNFVCTSDIDGANLYAKPGATCPNLLFRNTQ
jgi:hypothetical protein